MLRVCGNELDQWGLIVEYRFNDFIEMIGLILGGVVLGDLNIRRYY